MFNRLAAAALAALPAVSLSAADVTATWVGGPSGNWNVPRNWSRVGVPNNGANIYTVVIDGDGSNDAVVSLNITAIVKDLMLGVDDQLIVQNNVLFAITTGLANDGLLIVNSSGNLTDFRLDSGEGDLNFTGTGAVQFSNTQANRLYGNSGLSRLVNGVGHTVRGSLQFGGNQLRLLNLGLIDADTSQGMTLDLTDSQSHFNSGMMRASNGATLTHQNTGIDNSGGVIEAGNGSFVSFSGTNTVVGGTLRDLDVDGAGLVRNLGSLSLDAVTLDGPIVAANNTSTFFRNDNIVLDRFLVSSTGNLTDLRFDTSPYTHTTGTILCSNTQANRLYGIGETTRLIVAADGVIRGSMQLGGNQLALTNDGLIDTDAAQGMTLDLTDSQSHFNSGMMRASNGATLTYQNTGVDNSGGVIEAGNGSFVNFSGTNTVVGGTLRDVDVDGAGLVRNFGTLSLDAVTLEGPIVAANNTSTFFRNDNIVLDRFLVSSTGNLTDLRFDTSPYTHTTGTILCSNTQANRLYGIGGATRLIVAADGVIRGAMQLGGSQLTLTNDGLIDTDAAQGMTFDLTDGQSHFNTGMIRASNGATLTYQNTGIDNSGGIIEAGDASFVSFSGTSGVFGGTLRDLDGIANPGMVRSFSTTTIDSVTIEGVFQAQNNSFLGLKNTITNNGRLSVASVGNTTDVRVEVTNTTLTGTGEMVFSNTQANRLYGVAANTRLINAVGHTIRGSLQMGLNQLALTNDGAIVADTSQGMTIDITDGGANDFANNGTFAVTGGNVAINSGAFNTSGSFIINPGFTVTRSGTITQTNGVTLVNGALNFSSGGFSLNGGVLAGSGTIGGTATNSSGVVSPGNSAGTLTTTTYAQGINGSFSVEIGGSTPGSQHDVLAVTGTATLNGVLKVGRIDQFVPTPVQEFTILTAATRTGEFIGVVSCDVVEVIYTATSVKIRFPEAGTTPGDFNNDGMIDGADLGILLGLWGPCTESCCPADLNGDSIVDGADFGLLLGNWG